MNNDSYAPPQAVVADFIPAPNQARPWQVTVAVSLCWLSLACDLPRVVVILWIEGTSVRAGSSLFFALIAALVILFVLLSALNVFLSRGYRWARIVYSILTLLELLNLSRSVPAILGRALSFGFLDLVGGLLGAVALCLLFTGPANVWFRTRGGRIAPA